MKIPNGEFFPNYGIPNPHPPLTVDDTIIPESNSVKVLGFKFTWEPQIIDILGCARQMAGQLYHYHSFLTKQDMCTIQILDSSNITVW